MAKSTHQGKKKRRNKKKRQCGVGFDSSQDLLHALNLWGKIRKIDKKPFNMAKLFKLGNKGQSLAWTITVGLLVIVFSGITLSFLDELVMNHVRNIAIQRSLSGTYINIFDWGWMMIPVIITFTIVAGAVATAHFTNNEM